MSQTDNKEKLQGPWEVKETSENLQWQEMGKPKVDKAALEASIKQKETAKTPNQTVKK
jgi:hypothetical protein